MRTSVRLLKHSQTLGYIELRLRRNHKYHKYHNTQYLIDLVGNRKVWLIFTSLKLILVLTFALQISSKRLENRVS